MTLVTRIQESNNATFRNHPIIASSLSYGALLHTILCATNCNRCKSMPPCKDSECAQCSQPGLVTREPSKAASKADHSHPEQLQEMQSPRLPLLVFMVTMLLEIQARASQQANLLSSTLFHFFTTLERAICDGNFNQYPHRLENILMAFIRGFDVGFTPCPARPELWLLHGHRSRFGSRQISPLVACLLYYESYGCGETAELWNEKGARVRAEGYSSETKMGV